MTRRLVQLLRRMTGDARLVLHVDDNGIVVDAYFLLLAPHRGVSRLLVGRSCRAAPAYAMRLCGVCHAAHGIAAAEAVEDALGIEPGEERRLLRETVGLANRLQSHSLQAVAAAYDLLEPGAAAEAVEKGLRLYQAASRVLEALGGRATHPDRLAAAWGEWSPPAKGLDRLPELLEEARGLAGELRGLFADRRRWSPAARRLEARRLAPPRLLATGLYYGDKRRIDAARIAVKDYAEWRRPPGGGGGVETSAVIAFYDGVPAEAGPRARLALFSGFSGWSVMDIQRARLEDLAMSIGRLLELSTRLSPVKPLRVAPGGRGGVGLGVYEAPRGTLVHRVTVDADCRIRGYEIVTPTMFNIPLIEEAARGLPADAAGAVPKVFDPCSPCTVHLVERRGR